MRLMREGVSTLPHPVLYQLDGIAVSTSFTQ